MGCGVSKPALDEPGPCSKECLKDAPAAAKYLVQESADQSNGHKQQTVSLIFKLRTCRAFCFTQPFTIDLLLSRLRL